MVINFPGIFESRWFSILKRVLQALSKDEFCTNTANIGVSAKLDYFPEKFSSTNLDSFFFSKAFEKIEYSLFSQDMAFNKTA